MVLNDWGHRLPLLPMVYSGIRQRHFTGFIPIDRNSGVQWNFAKRTPSARHSVQYGILVATKRHRTYYYMNSIFKEIQE